MPPEPHLRLVPPPEPERQTLVGEYWPLACILLILVASLTIWAAMPADHTPGGHPSPSECVYSDC